MNNGLCSCLAASLLIHMIVIPVASLMTCPVPPTPVQIPVQLVDLPGAKIIDIPKTTPPAPTKPKPRKITAPKLVSKPKIIELPAPAYGADSNEELKETKTPMDPSVRPPLAAAGPGSVKGGWNIGKRAGEAEGAAAWGGNLFDEGDRGVVDGNSLLGGGGGKGTLGLGRDAKGNGTGGGGVSGGDALSSQARPLGGYQVKPRYPESARLAGAEGVTLIKLRILENGKVGEILIEESAGHPDLDIAAVEAVKKWQFEPARRGEKPVAVWMLLPVKFKLN